MGDGFGAWSRFSGSGSVVSPNDRNTAITSISKERNVFAWTISAPFCVSKTAYAEVYQALPDSFECVGCQIVSLGADADGNETFVNTCDPPVPLVVTDTAVTVTVTVAVSLKSLSVGSGT